MNNLEKNFMIVNEVWYDKRLSHKEKMVHTYLRGQYVYYQAQGNSFNESTKRICFHTQVNRTTLFKILNKLEDCGYLERHSEFGSTSEYILTDNLIKQDIQAARKSMGIKSPAITKSSNVGRDVYPQYLLDEEDNIPF